jgi:hypothetical protein
VAWWHFSSGSMTRSPGKPVQHCPPAPDANSTASTLFRASPGSTSHKCLLWQRQVMTLAAGFAAK